jgi:hypothetical protein
MSISFRSVSSTVTVLAAGMATAAWADCTNLVLRMQDPTSKREITSIFNCHEPSATVPGATTVHFYEWKEGKMCRSVQVCGNTRYWNVNVTIGGSYYTGTEVSKLTETVDSWSTFVGNTYSNTNSQSENRGEGNYHCASGTTYGEWQQAGYVDVTAGAYFEKSKTEAVFALFPSYREEFNGLIAAGKIKSTKTGFYAEGSVGQSWAEKFGYSNTSLACGYTNSAWANSSASTDSGTIGVENGQVKSKSKLTKDWDVTGIFGSVSLDFGEIKRFCSKTQDLGCM